MYLYNSYCYATIEQVSSSVFSNHFLGNGNFLTSSVVAIDGLSIDLQVNDSGVLVTHNFVPPSCSSVGFDNSFTGVSTTDAVEMGSLMVVALVAAWGIKILRRGL